MGVIGGDPDLRGGGGSPAPDDGIAPTRKLPLILAGQDPSAVVDRLPKGSSIPAGVLRRIMEGLGAADPNATIPTNALSPQDEEDASATAPMDQRALAAALGAQFAAQGASELAPSGPQSPADGIVSLADLVDDETTASSGAGRKLDLEDLNDGPPTTQNRRPRPRSHPDFGASETPKRGARLASKPTRPAVVRTPRGSRPSRAVPPPVVRPDTSPPKEAEPQSTVQMERPKASELPRLRRDQGPPGREAAGGERSGALRRDEGPPGRDAAGPERSGALWRDEEPPGRDAAGGERFGALREIPEAYGDSKERATVVKPNRRQPPKRTQAPRKSVLASVSQAPVPQAIPIQALQNRVTAETYGAGEASVAVSGEVSSLPDVAPSAVEDVSGSSGAYRSVLAAVLDEAGPVGMLRIVNGEAQGQIFALERAATTAGRGTDSDIVLLDLGVSRRHVVIIRHPEGFRLKDAQSGNGSFVNGVVVKESELYDGDVIRLGGTEMEFRTQGAPRLRGVAVARSLTIQPRRLALLGLITFCAAFTTMLVVEWAGQTSAEGLAKAGTIQWTKTAKAAADARRWRDAREALIVSRGFGAQPDHEALAVRIGRETDNARKFAELEREIEAKADFGTLDRILASIDQESVYRSDASQRARVAKKTTIERTIDEAESDLAKGRSEAARIKLEGVLQSDASHPRARKLLQRLR